MLPLPPGPFKPGFWRSPLRGPWLTSALGSILLILIAIVAATGFLSHAAYMPDLGRNAIVPKDRDVPLIASFFDWPTSPSWLYGLTQGLHTNVGLITIPFLLAKLWSVIPRLFAFPPIKSPAHAIERVSLALLVSSAVFELATGLVNAQYWYPFHFNFVVAHYWGGVIFLGSFLLHVAIKLPVALGRREEEPDALKAARPAPATISRRGLLAFTGAGAGLIVVGNGGQAIGGPLRKLSLLAPRRDGGFPVNKTARQAGITPAMAGAGWRLEVNGRSFTRDDLAAMPQRTDTLPIACVEGWSATRDWT